MKLSVIYELLKDTYNAWSEDKAPRLGAALAYYTVFSIAPLLIIAIGIAGLFFGEKAAQGEIVSQIEDTIGTPAAQAIEDMVKNTKENGTSTVAAVLGIIVLLFGASAVFVQLQDALNTIWKVTPKPGRGIWGIVRERLLSVSVVLGTGFLLLVSLVLSAALAAVGRLITPSAVEGGTYFWQVVNGLISLGFITVLFAMMYKFLPDVQIAWRDVWIGAAVTALLFTVGKYLIGLYLGHAMTTSSFGAAGSLVVILVWVYYSAQIFLFGAEFTRVYACRWGTCILPQDHAVAISRESANPGTAGADSTAPIRDRQEAGSVSS